MVSPLWIAADNGDIGQVQYLLKEASAIDIEIKDDAGATPLVQAAKNGHGDIVKALLDAGADPIVSTSHGSIEQLATDATVLELLASARDKRMQADADAASATPAPESISEQPYMQPVPEGYPQEYSAYGQAPPPGSYMYYPPPFPGAMLPDGSPASYYSPPPPPNGVAQPSDAMGGGSLPPPEIARLIPCRYFPACRYGPSCIFAHPQGPYFQGPLPPPAQYSAPYDPMSQSPYGGYYGMPQSPYPQPPPSANPMSPPQNSLQSPLSQPHHIHSGSEMMSPMQDPFSPTGAPPPVPYGVPLPGGYPPPGQMPIPPMSAGIPPAQQSAPQPNGIIYAPTSPVIQPSSTHRRDPPHLNGTGQFPQMEGAAPSLAQPLQAPPQQEAYTNVARPQLREGPNHMRRGSVRRAAALGPTHRKPPCAFFPSGRCRNGDACKFPHVLPDAGESTQGHYAPKYAARARAQTQPQADHLHEKMAGLSLRTDVAPATSQPTGQGQPNGFARPPHANNLRSAHPPNGARHEKRGGANGRSAREQQQHHPQQRVPSADDFPVLGGAVTPPSRSPIAPPLHGPTAAQVLKAPPPAPARSEKASTERTSSPSGPSESGSAAKEANTTPNGYVNGVNGVNANGINGSAPEAKPLSFAAVATVSANPPESAGTVSVSA